MKKILLGTIVLLFCLFIGAGCDTGTGAEDVVEAPDNSVTILNAPYNHFFVEVFDYSKYTWPARTLTEYNIVTSVDNIIGTSNIVAYSRSPVTINWTIETNKIPARVLVKVIQNNNYKFEVLELDEKYRATVDWNTMTDVASLPVE